MNRLLSWLTPSLSQSALSAWLAVYVGGLLNLDVWLRRLLTPAGDLAWPQLPGVLLAACCVMALTYLLLALSSFAGRRAYRVLASLLVLFSAAASYYMTFFDVVIGYGVMISVLTTDIDLSRESVGWQFLLWLVPTAGVPVMLVWRTRLRDCLHGSLWSRRTFWRPLTPMALALVMLLAPLEWLKAAEVRNDGQGSPDSAGVLAHSFLPSNWVAGLGMVAYQKVNEYRQGELLAPAGRFAYQSDPEREDVTVVFVIGETARADHMGLLGYARNTTPLLAQEPNLVAMPGWSCDTATKLSLRCMFVREGGAGDDAARTLKEQNVFATLKALGFSSELFAMQSELWFYDSVDADDYLFREMIAADEGNAGKPVDDMLLVPQLAQSLKEHPRGRHLVILHTKGSHYLYSQRHPREFARFTPECFSIDAACSKEQLVNSFDNSILYTDAVLKQVIDQVRGRKAIVFYTSDHGESIDDGVHFHATPRQIAPPEKRRVPMLVWMSDRLVATSGGRQALEALRARAASGAVGRHEELFDSVLGCIGYQSPDGGLNPGNNWCQPAAGRKPA